MNRNKCIIVVPIYKFEFDFDEYNSVKQLFKILPTEKYDIIAVCPESLDLTYYQNNFDFKNYYQFWDMYFNEYPTGYNRLVLSSGFYRCFEEYEYMLIYQPDCWIFRDELEYWCEQGYDYIGAPFLFQINYKYYLNSEPNVGNGGLSLRNIKFYINLCENYGELINNIVFSNDTMFGEDHIYLSLKSYGIDIDIKLPSFYEASKFSWETSPHVLYQVNNHKLPFGCHAYNKIIDSFFWDDFICYKHKAYAVITFLFGDYDILRDPDEIDEDAEYICITDRKDLISNVWRFEEITEYDISGFNDWQKSMIARYTALNHTNANVVFIIDASVHVKKSLKNLIYKYTTDTNVSLGLLLHPWRDSYLDELDEWIKTRNLDPIQKEQFIEYCNKHGYDYTAKGMIMTTIMIEENSGINKYINNYVLTELMNNYNFSMRVDQLYFSIIFINEFFMKNDRMLINALSMQVLDSDYFEYYYHGKEYTHSGEYKYDKKKLDIKLINNQKLICNYF